MPRSAGLIILFISAVLYWLGFSMLRPMVALYFNDAGYSMAWVGVLMAMHAFIPVLFAMPAGQMIDRIGPRKAVLYGSMIMVLSGGCYLWGGLSSALIPMLIGQLSNGLGSLLGWGAIQASVAQTAKAGPDAKRSHALLSNFAFVNSLAQFGGPILGGVVADWGDYTLVFILFTVLAGCCVLSSFLMPTLDRKGAGAIADVSFSLRKSYGSGMELVKQNRSFSMALLFNGVLFILVDLKGTFFPIYLANLAYTNTEIGTMLSIGGIASMVIRPFVGTLMNQLGHRWIMLGSLWLGCGCLFTLVFEPGYIVIVTVVFLWGLCAGVNQPVALIMVAQTVSSERQGMGMSLRTMANRIVQVVNPVAIGGLSAAIGLTFSFGLIALLLLGFSMTGRYMTPTEQGSDREKAASSSA